MALTYEELLLGIRVVAAAGLVLWLWIALDRKRWWPSQWSLHLEAAAHEPRAGDAGQLVVIVPARNEASTIPRTLPRLLKQHDWYDRLIVVDDRSDDLTASSAQRLASGTPAEAKLTVVRVDEVEDGWTGKLNAMRAGWEQARAGWHGDPAAQWILFTDADVLHPTNSLGRLLSKARNDQLDLVSVMVKLRTRDFWELLLIPPFVYFFQLLYPFRRASDPNSRLAAAAGGVLLVRRSVFEEMEGLESIRSAWIDDIAMARRAKRSGARCWLGLDPDMQSIRTYGGYAEISNMVTRTAFEQLGQRYVLVPLVWLFLLLMYVLPPVLTAYGAATLDWMIALPAGLAWLLSMVHFLPVVQYLGAPSGFVFGMPISAFLYGCMTTSSAWAHATGKRRKWRSHVEADRADV